MNELTVLSSDVKLPILAPTLEEEIIRMCEEGAMGTLFRESTLFRIWRIRKNFLSTEDGERDIKAWGKFVQSLPPYLGFSRSTLFSRIRLYDQLVWLGYNEEEAYKIVVQNNYLASKVLALVIDWRRGHNKEVELKTTYFGEDIAVENTKDGIKGLLEESMQHGNVTAALDNIRSNVFKKPIVEVYYHEGAIVIDYETVDGSVDSLRFERGDLGEEPVHEWVLEEIQQKYKIRNLVLSLS